MGLAIVTMAVSVLGPGGPHGLGAPEAVSRVAVPGVGVWLAATGQTRRARLGLATLAAWGAVFHVPSLLAVLVLVVAEPPVGQEVMAALFAVGWRGLPVAVAGAALLALRAGGDRSVLGVAGRRRAAALGIALWALAGFGVVLVGLEDWAVRSPEGGLAITLIGAMLVLLATAAVVWRQDRLAVVPAVLVVAAHALTTMVHTLVRMLGSPSALTPYPAGARSMCWSRQRRWVCSPPRPCA